MKFDAAALDRHITGNYGEDQFSRDSDPYEENTEVTCEEQLDAFVTSVAERERKLGLRAVAHPSGTSRWLRDSCMEIYVRSSLRWHRDRGYHILNIVTANVAEEYQYQGKFTKFLEYIERSKVFDGIFIENVHKGLAGFFRRREGYEEVAAALPEVCFIRIWEL